MADLKSDKSNAPWVQNTPTKELVLPQVLFFGGKNGYAHLALTPMSKGELDLKADLVPLNADKMCAVAEELTLLARKPNEAKNYNVKLKADARADAKPVNLANKVNSTLTQAGENRFAAGYDALASTIAGAQIPDNQVKQCGIKFLNSVVEFVRARNLIRSE